MIWYGSECWAVKKNDTQKLHPTEMRMMRWARGKTKKDHIKNEDIWREAKLWIKDNLTQTETIELVWPPMKEWREGYHQEDSKYAVREREEEGRWLDTIREDKKEYTMTEAMGENGRQRPVQYYMEKAYRWECKQKLTTSRTFCFCLLLHPSMCEAYCRCLYVVD